MTGPRPGIVVIGVSHHSTPVSIRERISVTADRLPRLYKELHAIDGLGEVVILSTCNRLEIYAVLDDIAVESTIDERLCAFQDFPVEEFLHHRYVLRNGEMLSHLFAVASGVDSQIVGEAEILGQVKAAYATAVEQRTVGAILNRTFQKCFQAAKFIRSNTSIGEGRINVATVAADLAEKIFGDIQACRVLVLGTGEVGEKTAKALASRGAREITVLSRSEERARELAEVVGGSSGLLGDLDALMPRHDIVVGSTSASEPVVVSEMLDPIMRQRRLRPLFFIDLGMPRNFSPDLAQLDSVFVYDLDDLARIADENLAARRAAVEHCREIARQRAERLWQNIEPRLFRRFETLKAERLNTRPQTT